MIKGYDIVLIMLTAEITLINRSQFAIWFNGPHMMDGCTQNSACSIEWWTQQHRKPFVLVRNGAPAACTVAINCKCMTKSC